MIRSVVVTFLIFCVGTTPAPAQRTTEDSVRAVVQGALDQLRTRDTAATRRIFTPTAVLTLVSYASDSTVLRSIPIAAIAAGLAVPGPGRREELRDPRVHIFSDLATVTARYVFYYDATLHHCGEAMYDLVRVRGQWFINAVRETDRRAGCTP